MLPADASRLWPVRIDKDSWPPPYLGPPDGDRYTELTPAYIDDYFRNGHTDPGTLMFAKNWGYASKDPPPPIPLRPLCLELPTDAAVERLISPLHVNDGNGNLVETGFTGLKFERWKSLASEEAQSRVLHWLKVKRTPVLVGFKHRKTPTAEHPKGKLSGYNHTNVIFGFNADTNQFRLMDPETLNKPDQEFSLAFHGKMKPSLYDQWVREDVNSVWFPEPARAATRYFEFNDDPAPVDLLTISPDGSRTGVDGTTGIEYTEDEDVSPEEFGNLWDIFEEIPPTSPPKSVSIRQPKAGTYRLQAVGKGSGQLQLDFVDVKGSSSEIDQNTVLSIDEPITAGEVQKFEMGYSGNNPATAEAVSSFSPEARAGNDTNGLTGVAVPFNGEASFDYDGTISKYAWEFGDGTSAIGANPSHAYSQPGTYTAKLTITDDAGRTATDTLKVTIELSQQKPVARLTGPYLATATRDVFLASLESFDRNNDPLTYKWDFGDGTTTTSDSFNGVNHAYAEPGEYEVTLIVNDGKEDSLPAKSNVKVLARLPEGLSVPDCVTPGSDVPVSLDNLFVQSSSWDIGYNGSVPEPPTVAEAQEQIDRTGPFGGEYGRAEGFGSTLKVESVEALSELTYTLNMTWQVPQDYAPGEHSVGFYNEGSDAFWNSSTSPCPVPENFPPLAHAGGPSYNASAGRPITLDGSQSSDPDGDSLTYRWNLGDGSNASVVKPTHTFSNPGRYMVQLNVNDGTQTSLLDRNSFAIVDVGAAPEAPDCTIGEIEPPVNDVSSADDPAMSAYKFGSRGVIPAKYKAACDGDPIDTQVEADAHPMKLTLTKLGSTPDQDAVVENTVTGSANSGDLFRFDDAADHYIYNVGVKNLASGTYKLTITEANGGATHDEWFSIK
jgi:PKD repeat protein